MEPPPPPRRKIINISGSFEPTGISECPGEPELRYNQPNHPLVEINDLQDEYFARNYKSPLTDLRDHVLVQVRDFSQPGLGVPSSFGMLNIGEGPGDINTPTSTMLIGVASPSHVCVPLSNIPNASVVSLSFNPSTHLSLSARVVGPSVPTIPTIGSANVVVTSVPSMPFTSYPLFQNFHNNASGSSPLVQGYPWYGVHIPPSMPYVVPTPTLASVSSGSPNALSNFNFKTQVRSRPHQLEALLFHCLVEGQ